MSRRYAVWTKKSTIETAWLFYCARNSMHEAEQASYRALSKDNYCMVRIRSYNPLLGLQRQPPEEEPYHDPK